MERSCSICPYNYVDGFDDIPKCHRHEENDGNCWAEEDCEYITIGDRRYVLQKGV